MRTNFLIIYTILVATIVATTGCLSQKSDQRRLQRIKERNPGLFDSVSRVDSVRVDTFRGDTIVVNWSGPARWSRFDSIFAANRDTVIEYHDRYTETRIRIKHDTIRAHCPPSDTVHHYEYRTEVKTVNTGKEKGSAWWEPWGLWVLLGVCGALIMLLVVRSIAPW